MAVHMMGQEVQMRALVAVVALFASVPAVPARAQNPPPAPPRPSASPAPAEANDPDPDSADLSITGTVTYRELKFDQAGTPNVEFSGRVQAPELGTDAKLHTIWHTDRGSLPKPVQTGVVYRDNTVRLTITTRFEDLARLFAEDAAPAAQPAPKPMPSPSPESDRQ
jgi:pyruvate/2-oxoglutarate dehydrogenase complex dihydrolipoamide acyltransferase (E2) component